jgi:IS605 OrfB family transposase
MILKNWMLFKEVIFRLDSDLPTEAIFLLEGFRLAVNNAIRAGLQTRVTSRNSLARLAYKNFREEHPEIYSQHVVSALGVAAGILKNYRRLKRKGSVRNTPYVRRSMMMAENQAYKLDRKNGVIDLPIKAGCHVRLGLVVSEYHRRYLDDATLTLGSLTILPDRVIIAFRKENPKAYVPESVVVLDTNERSLDGVFVRNDEGITVKADYRDVAIIQQRHHDRRRRLQRKKSNDCRMVRSLCRREGTREHHRVDHRMHQVANAVLSFAERQRSAVVIEDLKGIRQKGDRNLNRRLSMWPRRKLHQIIEYKAAWKGIPVVKVDPRYSSRKCSICGRIQDSRMGTEFRCECGWHLDRHINASLNLLQTAVSKGLEVAGGLRFDPGAFQHDVMMILYEPAMAARSEPNGTSQANAAT